jgi:hypothetical protein
MKGTLLPLAAIGLLVLGCDSSKTTSPTDGTPSFGSGSTVVHRVTAGGSDVDLAGPGGDANYSLVGLLRADGSASGQWTDQFGHGNGGFHAAIDCVHVVGNQAWVSGTVTSGNFQGFDLTGLPVITRLADNGRSANDPPDQVSFSFLGDPTPCTAAPPFDLFDKTRGQVTVD